MLDKMFKKRFLESIIPQCYNMYNKIIRIKITRVTLTNPNRNVNVNDKKMLSLLTDSYSKFLKKILKENNLRYSPCICIVNL